jgi:hypothetical protein
MIKMKGGVIAALIAIMGIGTAGAYLAIKKSPCASYTVSVAGNLNPDVGTQYNYTVTVKKAGKPVPNTSVILHITGRSPINGTTDSNGIAVFPLSFSSAGKYSINATMSSCQSNTIVASAHEPCGNGSIFYNGACTPAKLDTYIVKTDYTTIPVTLTITATLTNRNTGMGISSYTLTLTDITTGQTYNAVTSSKGIATFTVKVVKYGIYNFKVST